MTDQGNAKKILSYGLIIRYIFINFIVLATIYVGYAIIFGHNLLPDSSKLIRFDAVNYNSIKNTGYEFDESKTSTVAFFPGFPYIWKFSGLGILGISLLNLVIFITGFAVLCRHFSHNAKEILLFLSLPPIMFMYVPYSEALFFLPCVMVLIGLQQKKTWLVMVSLFLCSLCRSAANIFIPAIIIMELLSSENHSRIKNIIRYAISALAGILLVAWIQFYQTGQWFGFLTTQKHWGVGLRFPALPFNTWGDQMYLDGAALLAGLFVVGFLILLFFRFIKNKAKGQDKAYLFSLLYVSGLTVFTIAFKGGQLFSLNRYIIPTAFFFVVFTSMIWIKKFSFREIAVIGLIISIFWLICGSYVHIAVFAGFEIFTLYLCLYLLLNNKSTIVGNMSFFAIYIINIVVQVHFLYLFIENHWIG